MQLPYELSYPSVVCLLVVRLDGRLVGRSVIMSKKDGKLHLSEILLGSEKNIIYLYTVPFRKLRNSESEYVLSR